MRAATRTRVLKDSVYKENKRRQVNWAIFYGCGIITAARMLETTINDVTLHQYIRLVRQRGLHVNGDAFHSHPLGSAKRTEPSGATTSVKNDE